MACPPNPALALCALPHNEASSLHLGLHPTAHSGRGLELRVGGAGGREALQSSSGQEGNGEVWPPFCSRDAPHLGVPGRGSGNSCNTYTSCHKFHTHRILENRKGRDRSVSAQHVQL